MKILDFCRSPRCYLIPKALSKEDTYRYYSEREPFCRQIREYDKNTDTLMVRDDLNNYLDYDIALIKGSMYYKTDKLYMSFLNKFKGKVVAVDYAWDAYLKKRYTVRNPFMKCKVHGIAIIIKDENKFAVSYSKPEPDMMVHVSDLVSRKAVLDEYQIPDGYTYILVTSNENFKVDYILGYLSSLSNIHVIWKGRHKHQDNIPEIEKKLKARGISYTMVIGDPLSHKDFLSPSVKLSTLASMHIHLGHKNSSTHLEMIRVGIPTYWERKNKLIFPEVQKDYAKMILSKEGYDKCINNISIGRCDVGVDNLFLTKNLVSYLKQLQG